MHELVIRNARIADGPGNQLLEGSFAVDEGRASAELRATRRTSPRRDRERLFRCAKSLAIAARRPRRRGDN